MDSVKTAQSVAVPTAFMPAGYYTCSSQNPLPIILDQPAAVSTQIFSRIYSRGVAVVAPGTIIAATAFGYLAYTSNDSRKRKLYGSSAVLAIAVLPWTTFVTMSGIKRLQEIGKKSGLRAASGTSTEVTQLLTAWKGQNYVRAGLAFVAGMVGLLASL